MDMLNKLAAKVKSGSSTTDNAPLAGDNSAPLAGNSGAAVNSPTGNTAPAGQLDMGDKGLAAVENRFGITNNNMVNERITDGAREYIEKATGKNIPDKISN